MTPLMNYAEANRVGVELASKISRSLDHIESRVWSILKQEDFERKVREAYEKKVRLLKESLKEKKEVLPTMPLIKKDSPLYEKYAAKTIPVFKDKTYMMRAMRLKKRHTKKGVAPFIPIQDIYAEKLKDYFVENARKYFESPTLTDEEKKILSFSLKVIQKLKISEPKIDDLISASIVDDRFNLAALLQNFRDYLREN